MKLKSARSLCEDDPRRKRELSELLLHIDSTPKAHTVKGMYIAGVLDLLDTRDVERPRKNVQRFKDYPIWEYSELLLDAAVTLYPTVSAQQGLRSIGRLAIPTFASSIVGAVLMGTVGRNWELALKCVSKGYEVSLRPGSAEVVSAAPGRALLQLRHVWNFGESYQVGVVEGLMEWCGLQGTVVPAALSACDFDFKIEWADRGATARKPSRGSARSRPPPPL